jgi:hypothetical protein
VKLLDLNSSFATRVLQTTGLALVTAPPFATAIVRGFVQGTTGEFGHFGASENDVNQQIDNASFPFLNGAMAIPCGAEFVFLVAPKQQLWARGSVFVAAGSKVFATYHVFYAEPEIRLEGIEGVPGTASFRGPNAAFMKKGV